MRIPLLLRRTSLPLALKPRSLLPLRRRPTLSRRTTRLHAQTRRKHELARSRAEAAQEGVEGLCHCSRR